MIVANDVVRARSNRNKMKGYNVQDKLTPAGKIRDIEEFVGSLKTPVLILSTVVGKGNYSVGEALQERFSSPAEVHHNAIEEILPRNAVNEDKTRYHFISNKFPALLNLVYRFPVVYCRKLLREKYLKSTDLGTIHKMVVSMGIKTVICISHRPAFWVSAAKLRYGMNADIWGIQTEYGKTFGWKYIFWESMDGFLAPVEKDELNYPFRDRMKFDSINQFSKREYQLLKDKPGDKNNVLFCAGQWGQIGNKKAISIIASLRNIFPRIRIFAVCGTNASLKTSLENEFSGDKNITVYPAVSSLCGIMRECASVITKPGFSTLNEAYSANREIFLLKGMPVAEDNNARYALKYFRARWYDIGLFGRWYQDLERTDPAKG